MTSLGTVETGARPVDFDAVAGIYDSVFAPHVVEHYLRRRATYLLRLSPGPNATFLDVGAGTGALAERLTDLGLRIVAVDPFPGMLAQLEQRRPDIATVVGEGEALPFADATFDVTYSVAVMHHIAAPSRVRLALAEMVRVTRPGGRIVVWDHNPLNPYWRFLMRRVPQDNGTERLIPQRELVAGLRAAGAEVVRAERSGFVPEFVPRSCIGVAAAVERAIEATPGLRKMTAHNVVLARKR
jgi:SAM-dependent methyltransferase